MTKATEKELSALHSRVTKVLIQCLDCTETIDNLLNEYELPDAVVDFLKSIRLPSPAILQTATKFLKDNDIYCDADTDNGLQEIQDSLNSKRRLHLVKPSEVA